MPGRKIWVLDNREAGNRLEVTGSAEFKKTTALTATKHGLQMQFRDQNMQRIYELARSGQQRELERGDQKRGDFGREPVFAYATGLSPYGDRRTVSGHELRW